MKSPFAPRLPKRFRPGLERLETRDCPSCTVFQKGATLSILGDRGANRIDIAETPTGGMSVTCEAGDPHVFTGVRRVEVRTLGGDDEVTATLTVLPENFQFGVDLGTGNDRLAMRGFDPQPDPPPRRVSVDILAGEGNDDLDIDWIQPPENRPDTNIQLRADLGGGNDELHLLLDPLAGNKRTAGDPHIQVNVLGREGNDCMELAIEGPRDGAAHVLNANLDVNFDGGAGDDEFMMNVAAVALDGAFMMHNDGGAGDDQFTMNVSNVALSGQFMMFTDGGAGIDKISARMNNVDFAGPAVLGADLRGGAGNDIIDVESVDPTGEQNGPTDRAQLKLTAGGGDGKDQIHVVAGQRSAEADPQLRLDWNFAVTGDAGDDLIDVSVYDLDNRGRFALTANGGAGNDHLIVGAGTPCDFPASEMAIKLFGDAGDDLIEASVTMLENMGGRFVMEGHGGAGNDHLIAGVGGPCDFPASKTAIKLFGDAGDDLVESSVADLEEMGGRFVMEAHGGAGNDHLNVGIGTPCDFPASEMAIYMLGDAGNDRLDLRVAGSADEPAGEMEEIQGTMRLNLDGGLGNDTAALDLAALKIRGALLANLQGGDGADRLQMSVSHDVDVFGTLDIRALGGAGNDVIAAAGAPCDLPSGRAIYLLDGEAGNDRIAAQVDQDEDDTGVLVAFLRGGAGDDDLTLDHQGSAPNSLFVGLVDGGNGADVAHVTRDILVFASEKVSFLN